LSGESLTRNEWETIEFTTQKEVALSSDREVQARRRTALYEILTGDRRVTEQKELVALLLEQGIPATQPSVSRDLKALGAIRARGYYEIPSWEEEEDEEGTSPFRRVLPFILSVRPAGPHQTLLVTKPGAGRVVAQAISESEWEEIVGTIDGDSAVLILTESFLFQRLVYERIKHFVKSGGEYEIVELE
jgi:transcriptional regulator of arginine metabolism